MTDIDEIRGKIKALLEHYFSEEMGEGASGNITEEILNTEIVPGEECGCNLQTIEHKVGQLFDIYTNTWSPCPRCNGTGKRPPPMTIEQAIKEKLG